MRPSLIPTSVRKLRRGPAALATLMVTAGALSAAPAVAAGPAAAAGPATVNVSVNAGEGLGTIPSTAYGLNASVSDGQMNAPPVQRLLQQAGVGLLRYPGGITADLYNWQNNTAPGIYVAPGTSFDSFMGTVKKIGAQPMLTANYGTGTPAEAAAWVRYANITKGYGAKYWEIANEIYGNGYYGANWEADNHPGKSPATYAGNVLQFASAMKAVDPTIKIGVVLSLPGNWPTGLVASGDSKDWNQTVLSIAGSAIDFVIVHWYQELTSVPAAVLTEPALAAGELAQLRQEINQYAGPRGPNIGIALNELNSNVDQDTQPGALFSADTYMTALENGAFTVDWWDTHNFPSAIAAAPDGATDYGDTGILSAGTCVHATCEPALNTPFPAYYSLAMLSKLGRPGDTMLHAGTDQQLVAAHAVRNANGNLSVMLVNKDPANSYQVSLHYAGYTPAAAAPVVYTYGDEASSITSAAQGTAASQVLPPYSIETIVLTPQAGTLSALSAPGTPAATNITNTQATISWAPSAGGQVTGYQVSEQSGTGSVVVGSSASDSFTASNLLPGTTYTFNAAARDSRGYLSLPSAPVTFTTSTPGNAPCAVAYNETDGWGTGFVVNIRITDTSPSPVNGWRLAFTFPASTEKVSGTSHWGGNWTENGRSVTVTNLATNGLLEPHAGNAVTLVFVGANVGANPSPTVSTLNGAVCTTTYSS
jgi:Cellulose binding domain/Fibronectin type III domain